MYGFLRVESGRSQGSYFHPDFCKMDQEKSLTIKRHQSRQNHHRKCTPSFKLFKVYPSVMDVTRTIQMSDTSKSPSKHIPSSNMVISSDPPEYASTILNIAQRREAFPFANSFGQLPEHQQRMFIEEILDASDNEYMFEPRPIEMMLCSSLSLPMSPTFFIL